MTVDPRRRTLSRIRRIRHAEVSPNLPPWLFKASLLSTYLDGFTPDVRQPPSKITTCLEHDTYCLRCRASASSAFTSSPLPMDSSTHAPTSASHESSTMASHSRTIPVSSLWMSFSPFYCPSSGPCAMAVIPLSHCILSYSPHNSSRHGL